MKFNLKNNKKEINLQQKNRKTQKNKKDALTKVKKKVKISLE